MNSSFIGAAFDALLAVAINLASFGMFALMLFGDAIAAIA